MQSEDGGRSCSPKAFHRLRDLPLELRQYIWSLARPRRRVVSLYLGRAHFNQSIITRTSTPISVPTILHVCHESREVAKGIYQQGLGNDTVTWDMFWWDPCVDILYLSPLPNWREMPVVHDNDSDQVDEEDEIAELPSLSLSAGIGQVRIYNLLSQVEHLAIPVDFAIAMGLTAPVDDVDDSDEGPMTALLVWIQRFPSLKSLNLLIDPFCDWSQERKIVLLHEPLDVASRALFGLSPSNMELVAAERLLEWKKQNDLDWEPPLVKVHVMGFWSGRNIKFCVPKATSPI